MSNEQPINRVLITGIMGSGGSYLAESILNNQPNVEVHGIARWHSTTSKNNIRAIQDKIHVHEADLVDFGSVFSVLEKVRPDIIFHLAGMPWPRNWRMILSGY